MLKRVTAVCMEAMPAFSKRSSHVPGSSARAGEEIETSVVIIKNRREAIGED